MTPHSEQTGSSKRASLTRPARRGGNRVRLWLLALTVLASSLFAASCGSSPPSPTAAADTLIAKGLRAEAAGQFKLAASDFHSAAVKDRSYAVPYFQLGALYQRLGFSGQAAAAYKRALSINPKYRQATLNLAVVDTKNQPQAAMNLYNQLLLRNPKDAQVDFNLGLLLIAQLQPTPGHALLKHAIKLDPALAKKLPAGITP